MQEFGSDVISGKFLFVGLGGSGKTTILSLMSVNRKVHNTTQQSRPSGMLSFMYPVEKKSLHDPISSALSAERRGSTVVKKRLVHEGTGSRRKTVRGALGAQSAPRTSKLGGASGHSGGGGGRRRGSAAVLGEKEKKVEPIRSASETLSPREVEKAKLLRPASSLVAPTNINVKEKGVGGGGIVQLGGLLPLPQSSTLPTNHTCLCRGHIFTAVDQPGRPAFRHSWYDDIGGVRGIVMVVDVGDREAVGMAKKEIRRLGKMEGKIPVLVMGNKSDTVTTSNEGYDDEVLLAEVLEIEKWLRNDGGRMWTVRIVSARDMEGVGDAMCWVIDERLKGKGIKKR